jgi:tRNA uridine 5-carboxymethylaminomethyl modification enzyme
VFLNPGKIPSDLADQHNLRDIKKGVSLSQFLARPPIGYEDLERFGFSNPEFLSTDGLLDSTDIVRAREQVELAIKYDGYLARQQEQVVRSLRLESVRLPESIDYSSIRGLRTEAALKLADVKPGTLGQASRIAGVNPADVTVLQIHLKATQGKPS